MPRQAPADIQTYSEVEVAHAIGVSRITLLRARKRGMIGYHRIGSRVVYTVDQIRAFLHATERAPLPRKTASP
jgi:hypothetical protein